MSKPLTKAQLRKQKIKEETALANEKIKKVKDADENPNNISDLPMFHHFTKNDIIADMKYFVHCPEEYQDWVFDLTKRNMQELYEKTWGWNDNKKRHELFDDLARYLILINADKKPIGFAHIRFEFVRGQTRIYIYEFQVEPEYQGKGVGRFIMNTTEFIALKRGLEAVTLTVFKINEGAYAFYTKMHYIPSETSPSVVDPGHPDAYDYEILTKSLVKKK
ncbi:N-alpha-acetyltransferase 40 [Tritrichomonas foetus]|uniref:N-alpha-acetyltransferase 40 n=1 Tax=Tritrichomonas foetus TaxID=1144522 RepID=A0A1J4JPL8_9EUKA|nr:N-alpha-acetyltransferase 40 [Tritrichomonas foetus]|eukprot:OHS99459.1 N-alpha-acetyltransferase 40 [Tritrichomonas foetus]